MCFEKTQWLQSQTEKRKPCAAPKVYLISNNQGFHTAIINHWQISLPHLCLESKKIATVCLGEIDRPATPANRCWTLGCTSGIRVVCCSGGQAGSDLPNHRWLWRSLLELRHSDGCATGTKEMVPLPCCCCWGWLAVTRLCRPLLTFWNKVNDTAVMLLLLMQVQGYFLLLMGMRSRRSQYNVTGGLHLFSSNSGAVVED